VRRIAFMASALICVCGAGYSSQSGASGTSALLLGDLVRDPAKYDGNHVTVRGYVVVGPESRNIFESQKAAHSPSGVCLGLDGPDIMFTSFHKAYRRNISGIFRRNLCGEHDVCLYWCGQSGIELDKNSKP
jgi:hypothetical protein